MPTIAQLNALDHASVRGFLERWRGDDFAPAAGYLPVFADALEEAGWDDPEDLDRLRRFDPVRAPAVALFELYGRRVVAVLARPKRYECLSGPCGRAAFPGDEQGFRHACTPEDWR